MTVASPESTPVEIAPTEESNSESVNADESNVTEEIAVITSETPEAAQPTETPQDFTEISVAEPADTEDVSGFDAEENEEDNNEDVNVILKPTSKGGIYKTGATYQARSASHSGQLTKTIRQGIELDDPGDIQGVPTLEFNLSNLGEEEKPWKRPGADITDYFNYGFTEETWIQYCEKQKILRQEYANATLKPVLATGGTGLLQRLRTGTSNVQARNFDTFKQANINVINLSNNVPSARGILNSKAEPTNVLLNGSSAGLLGNFTQPPPGYPAISAQADGSAAFTNPPPGFPATQLLAGPNAAGGPGILPNLSLPPPIFNWPGAVGVAGLLPADAMIDPTTGQITSSLDRPPHSPESVYSNEDHSSRRRSRHHRRDSAGEDGSYFERDSHRSRRRSRSDSRDRYHSRHYKHRDSGRSDRDYDRRSGRRSHRSRDRFSRDDKYSDNLTEPEDYPAPTSAILHSRGERSSRDRSRDDANRSGYRSGYRRDRDRSSRSSRPSRHRSRSRSPRRREDLSPPRGTSVTDAHSPRKSTEDPLLAATAAAANIALAIGGEEASNRPDAS